MVSFEWYEGAMAFLDSIFIFLFRTNGCSKQKLLDISYVQNSFSVITRHIDNDTLQLRILQTRIKIPANSFMGKYHQAKINKGSRNQWYKILSLFFEENFIFLFLNLN